MDAGTYELGPDNATLRVLTERAGAAAKAGHDLQIEVTSWSGKVELREPATESRIALDADSGSLKVRAGTGGMMALGSDDIVEIERTIDDEVLKRRPIVFRSTAVEPSATGLLVSGDLEIAGTTRPVRFELGLSEGDRLTASTRLLQSEFGIKPYSALFGALKVADEIEITVESELGG